MNDDKTLREEPRSVEELIEIALAAPDDAAADIVEVLQARGNREVFELACKLCEAPTSHHRQVGVWILSQNMVPDKTFAADSVPVLLRLLEREQHVYVLQAIGIALGHLRDPRAILALAGLKHHPAAEVRYGVVQGLSGHDDLLAVGTLIELSTDSDRDVRDWATFAIGSLIDTDSPAIREALLTRLTDEDDETRGEALVGLASRGDERVVEPLLRELSLAKVGSLAVEAARDIGNPRLYPVLIRLRERWHADEGLLNEAIDRCKDRA